MKTGNARGGYHHVNLRRGKRREGNHSRLLDLTLQVCRGMLLVDELIVQLVNQHDVTRFSNNLFIRNLSIKQHFLFYPNVQ